MVKVIKSISSVIIKITTTIGYEINFENQRSTGLDAELLSNQINSDLYKLIASIRRDAYNLGWEEAKSKKVPKRNWFNGNINSDHI